MKYLGASVLAGSRSILLFAEKKFASELRVYYAVQGSKGKDEHKQASARVPPEHSGALDSQYFVNVTMLPGQLHVCGGVSVAR